MENLQDIDMMDISVLDEAEIDNGSVADCVEEDDADNLPESLSDSRELGEGDMKELPEQLQQHSVGAWSGGVQGPGRSGRGSLQWSRAVKLRWSQKDLGTHAGACCLFL